MPKYPKEQIYISEMDCWIETSFCTQKKLLILKVFHSLRVVRFFFVFCCFFIFFLFFFLWLFFMWLFSYVLSEFLSKKWSEPGAICYQKLVFERLFSPILVPKLPIVVISTWHLSGFAFKFSNHLKIILNGIFKFVTTSSGFLQRQSGVAPLAWLVKFVLLLKRSMSHKNWFNKSGPRTEPCVTSNKIYVYVLNWSFIVSPWLRSVKWFISFLHSKEKLHAWCFAKTRLCARHSSL